MAELQILAFEGVADGPFGITLDVLGAAARIARAGLTEPTRPLLLAPRVLSLDGAPVRTAAGRPLPVDAALRTQRFRRGDVLILPGLGMASPDEIERALRRPEIVQALPLLARAHARGALLAASCSATFVLGAAGVLTGREATTTWWLGAEFARRFPRTRLRDDRMVVASEDVITAGSALAHADLMLVLLARLAGLALADTTARYLVLDGRASQARYMIHEHLRSADPGLSRLERFVAKNLGRQLELRELARAALTSPRTLARRLRSNLNTTPKRFVQRIRVERAVHLLATTKQPVDAIAAHVGYADAAAFRRVLRRETGQSPRELRGVRPPPEGAAGTRTSSRRQGPDGRRARR